MSENILVCKGMNKSFGPTKAVVDVDFSIQRGEICGLIGENGSGKSTLCSLFTGTNKPDKGEMILKGDSYSPSSLLESKTKGISILLQEQGTLSGLSVAENIFLGKERQFRTLGFIDKWKMNREAQKLVDAMGLDVSSALPVDVLSFENRKLIEVIKAMADNPDLLIVDETTTALSQYGREKIYEIVRKMKNDNKAVIMITHDLNELMDICDAATVMRDGHCMGTVPKQDFSEERIRQLMIGRDLSGSYYREDNGIPVSEEIVLKVENVSFGSAVKHVSFDLHKGEILGIGGLTDCGMHTLAKLIFGALKCDAGHVVLTSKGVEVKSPEHSIKNGLAYIPKDRDQESVFLSSAILENVTVSATDKLIRHGLFSKKAEAELAIRECEALSVKMQSIKQYVRALSGGNKQKVAFAKWMATDCDIFLMDCPTRGIDIGVKAAIYELMERLKENEKSIIMISEELPELIGMADRIIIMKDGMLNGEFNRADKPSETQIIASMI